MRDRLQGGDNLPNRTRKFANSVDFPGVTRGHPWDWAKPVAVSAGRRQGRGEIPIPPKADITRNEVARMRAMQDPVAVAKWAAICRFVLGKPDQSGLLELTGTREKCDRETVEGSVWTFQHEASPAATRDGPAVMPHNARLVLPSVGWERALI